MIKAKLLVYESGGSGWDWCLDANYGVGVTIQPASPCPYKTKNGARLAAFGFVDRMNEGHRVITIVSEKVG